MRLKVAVPSSDDGGTMQSGTQFVAYQAVAGAMLTAPLPSAPEVGSGWRGVPLRRFHPLDQFDPLVVETASKSEAAIGLAVDDTYAYVIAVARGHEPVRLVLAVDLVAVPEGAADAVARCGVSGTGARFRKAASRALAAWSSHSPRTSDQTEIGALFAADLTPSAAMERLTELLGIALPAESIPNPLDLQAVARDQVIEVASTPKRRWFSRSG